MQTKYIFFTGGVLSSLGKGVTAAAIGRILKVRGFNVTIQKLDPYLNVDPGTMSPYQHGEVFVLDDGTETDLDLGHYERFVDLHLTKASTVTTGQIYEEVIARERKGDYLGGTIQVIPHITNEIKRHITYLGETSKADVVLVEVGGTVGDIESLPFLEAIREIRTDLGRDNTAYIHLTWLPYLQATNELKTKPTQHSVRELRSLGILADMIIARSDYPVDESIREKIALFCDVKKDSVIPLVTTDVLYEIPLILENIGAAEILLERLQLKPKHEPDWKEWNWLISQTKRQKPVITIGLVGKYVELHDAYISVREALNHAALYQDVEINIDWIASTDLEKGKELEKLRRADGIIVPGGFGSRGVEGKIIAAQFARKNKIPFLGLCLGMQAMIIEFAREILGDDGANSTEFDQLTNNPVIDLMPNQHNIVNMGATMRLGLYPCKLISGSRVALLYEKPLVQERHRHRYEVNNKYRAMLEENGMLISGISPDNRLVEVVEIKDHPYMIGCQFHPEFTSRPNEPHPLFEGFISSVINRKSKNI